MAIQRFRLIEPNKQSGLVEQEEIMFSKNLYSQYLLTLALGMCNPWSYSILLVMLSVSDPSTYGSTAKLEGVYSGNGGTLSSEGKTLSDGVGI